MKKIFIPVVLLMAACQSATTSTKNTGEEPDQPSASVADEHAITDPVCGMIKDSTWTDYTIYKGDTVWFCAATEKVAFEANPSKYERNIRKQ